MKKKVEGPAEVITDYLNGFQYKDGLLQFFPHAEGYVNNTVVDGNNNYNYVFNYTDHLGNVRLSYTNSVNGLEILEENNYYPFGLKHANYNMDQKNYQDMISGEIKPVPVTSIPYNYKYNGKELQDELGLNWYDYGWRNYMPDIGRWSQIDPLFNDLKFAHDNLDVDPDDEDEVYLAIINDAEVGGGIYNTDNLNPYGYGYNNPVSFDDPDGRCPSCDDDPIGSILSWTDVDDIAVAVTTVTRGILGMYDGKPKHIDGTDAEVSDAGYLAAGILIPGVSGGTLKKIFKGGEKAIDAVKKVEKKASRENVTKVFSSRKKAMDARPKPSPAKKGQKQVTRQSRNKAGEGKKMKTDGGSQTPHYHDKNHGKKNKTNVHYRVKTKKIKPN